MDAMKTCISDDGKILQSQWKCDFLRIMAKNSLSEGDLVTKQPGSVGIFSLSSEAMGKGLDGASEVNGNYKQSEIDVEHVGVFKVRTGSVKSGSRVSFADENLEGNLSKVCSDTEIHRDIELNCDEVTKTAYLLERSISCSAIERTKPDYFSSNSSFVRTEPLDTVIPENEIVAPESDCVIDEGDDRNSSQLESDFEVTDVKIRDLDEEHCNKSSQNHPSPKGKPPLPNGRSKHRPGSGKQSWLLRLFESKMFDMSIAISYLFNSKEPGVQTYLGERISLYYYLMGRSILF